MTREDLKKQLSKHYLGDYLEQYFKQGYEQGRAQAIEEGIKIGEARKEEELVSNLLKTGIESEKISNLTEIPLERVLEIKAKYNI